MKMNITKCFHVHCCSLPTIYEWHPSISSDSWNQKAIDYLSFLNVFSYFLSLYFQTAKIQHRWFKNRTRFQFVSDFFINKKLLVCGRGVEKPLLVEFFSFLLDSSGRTAVLANLTSRNPHGMTVTWQWLAKRNYVKGRGDTQSLITAH